MYIRRRDHATRRAACHTTRYYELRGDNRIEDKTRRDQTLPTRGGVVQRVARPLDYHLPIAKMPLFSRGNGAGTPDRPDKSERTDKTEDPPTPSSSSKSFSARLLRRRPSTKAVPPPIDPGDTDASASASEPPTASSDGFSLGPPVPTPYGDPEGRGPVVGVGMGMGQFGSVSPRLKRPPRPPYTTGSSGSVSGDGTTQRTVVIDAGGPAPTWSTPLSFGAGSSSASFGAGGGTNGSWHDARDQHSNSDGGPDPQWARVRRSVDEVRGGLGGGPGGRIADPSTFPTRPLTLDDPLPPLPPPLPVGAQGPTYPTPLSPPRRNTAPRVRPPIPFDQPQPQPPAPGPSTSVTDSDPADPNPEGEAAIVGSKAWLARKPSTGKLRRPRPDPPVAGVSSPVLRRTNPQRSPMAPKPPTTPDRSTDYPSRSQGAGTLQPSPVLLTASSSSGGRRASPSKRRGEDGSSLGGSASVESSDLEGEGEIGLGASAGAASGEGGRRRTPSPTLMPSRVAIAPNVSQRGGGYEVQVSCVAAPSQPALELEPSATAQESGGSGEITWTITIRPRARAEGGAGAGGRDPVAPSSPLHISASLPGPTGVTSDSTTGDSGRASGTGTGSTIASAPLSASSVNLSLSLSQPVGKMVFISFPLDMTPRRAARRPSRSSKYAATGTAGSPPPSVDLAETPSRLDRVDRGKALPSTTREKRSGWILGSPSPSPAGDLGGEEEDDDLPLTPPRIRTPGAPTPSTPPRMTTPPPNPITPRRVLKYGPQNGQGPAGSPARTPRRSREGPLVYPNGGGPTAHPGSRDASLSRAVGRRSIDGRPGFGAAYGSSGGSGGSSGSAGTEDLSGSLGGGGSARRSRIISASDLDGGLYAPGTVDGLSEELERAL